MEVVRAQGWEIRQEVRKHGISAGQVDKYYMPPNGDKRLTSLRKVRPELPLHAGQHSPPAALPGGLLLPAALPLARISRADAPRVCAGVGVPALWQGRQQQERARSQCSHGQHQRPGEPPAQRGRPQVSPEGKRLRACRRGCCLIRAGVIVARCSVQVQPDFDAARGGVAALLAAQAEAAADVAGEAAEDEEWSALGVAQGFGVAAAERVKRRRRKPGGTPGAYVSPLSLLRDSVVMQSAPPGPVCGLDARCLCAGSLPWPAVPTCSVCVRPIQGAPGSPDGEGDGRVPVLALSSPLPPAGKPTHDPHGSSRSRTLKDLLDC